MNDFKKRQKKMITLLDFIQADLKSLTEEETAVLQIRLQQEWFPLRYVIEGIKITDQGFEGSTMGDDGWGIKAADGRWRALQHKIFQTIQKKLRSTLNDLMAKGKMQIPMVKEILTIRSGLTGSGIIIPVFTTEFEPAERFPGRFEVDSPKAITNLSRPVIKATLREFARALEGIPGDSILKCQECKKYFIHISRKEKLFCTTRCAYRFTSRKRREELKSHPKKYKAFLKKQRETMREKYEERQRARGYKKINHYQRKGE